MSKATLKPKQGIQINQSKKYLFDPAIAQGYVDDAKEWADKSEASAIRSEASAVRAEGIVNSFDAHVEEAKVTIDQFTGMKIDDIDSHAAVKEQEFNTNAAEKQQQVDTSANNANVSELKAKASELNSKESERRASIWAEGTDSEVASLGGEKSAKGWANKAAEIVGAGVIQDDIISLKTTYSSDKLEKIFAVNEDHDSVLDCLDVLDTNIGAKTTVPLSALLAIDSDARPSHKAKGAEVYDEFGTMGIIDSVTPTEAVIITKESREKVRIVDTLDIQKNGLGQYYVDLNSNQIRNEIIKGKIVQLRFDDVITNTGEQLYPFETFDKDGYAVFRRNVITADKAERINIKVDYQGIVTFDTAELQKADIDLANTGRITNCITEIPQDIKLELKDGTLTLKAGSKVYVPNGIDKFDVKIIDNDVSLQIPTSSSATYDAGVFYNYLTGGLGFDKMSIASSGSISPKEGFFYNTNDNTIKYYSNSSPSANMYSFPFAIVKKEATKITSIDRVFNGFGYIGSTVYGLPGVKGLIPDGRNTDGSLRSIETTINKVITRTYGTEYKSNYYLFMNNDEIQTLRAVDYIYNSEENIVRLRFNGEAWFSCLFAPNVSIENGRITSFNPKQVFHALDYNDKSEISGWSLPVYKTNDLPVTTLPFTAPKDGWLHGWLQGDSANIFRITNATGDNYMGTTPAKNLFGTVYCFMRKGETFKASGAIQTIKLWFSLTGAEQ